MDAIRRVEFFPIGDAEERIEENLTNLFRDYLYSLREFAFAKRQYLAVHPELVPDDRSRLTIIQISDVHIGSTHAELYLRRLKQLVLNLIDELGVDRTYLSRLTEIFSIILIDETFASPCNSSKIWNASLLRT